MKPYVAVVLPSLNEEATLRETCKSLGFCKSAASQPSPGTLLFIVDNGSTDKTLELAYEIRRTAPPGSVFIGQEKERGYVPPRHTGNILVKAFAEHNRIDLSEILILQADADTSYEEGYIEWMRSASESFGPNLILEGLAEFSSDFCDTFPEYVQLSAGIDARVLSILKLPETSDLVCTDAVCGYRLSDYFAWGGHLREWCDSGDEIHAETTRLYLRALAHGARKVCVKEALAHPAERKIISHPGEEFATAGFPREASWRASWEQRYQKPVRLADFLVYSEYPEILHATRVRERHLVALFGLLPVHVARAIEREQAIPIGPAMNDIAVLLRQRNKETLSLQPGVFLTDVLEIVDYKGAVLDAFLMGQECR
jgi:hypothetical protein